MLRRQLVLTYFLIPARTDRSLAGKSNRRTPEIPDWRADLQKYVKPLNIHSYGQLRGELQPWLRCAHKTPSRQ
jgi:hypothetical protein